MPRVPKSPKKVARKVAKRVARVARVVKEESAATAATVSKVTRVISHAKESLKLLEALSAERTRKASNQLISGVKKLGLPTAGFTLEAMRAEELATLRTEVASLRSRVERLELQASMKPGQSRREQAFAEAADTLPRT